MPIPVTFHYGVNADGSPKRLDMFTLRAVPKQAATEPPKKASRRLLVSEGTQEVIVDVARRRLVIPRAKKALPVTPPPPSVKEPEKEVATRKEEGSQTNVSYCQHECAKHPRVNGDGNGKNAKNGKDGKEGKDSGKEATKDAGGGSGKEAEKGGGKNTGKKKKGKDKESANTSSDAESSDSMTDGESPSGVGKRVRIDPDLPSSKRQDGKVKKREGSKEAWDPSALPYLAALLPPVNKMSRSEKQAIERHAQRSREALEASRTADEEEARRWVSEQLAATHSGALRWLRERDVTRQTAATAASSALFDPAELKIALDEVDGVGRMRPSPFLLTEPVLRATPDPKTPLWALPDDLEPVVRSRRPLSTPLVLFQDNDQISTLDGRPVRIVQRAGNSSAPKVSLRGGGPLRESSGNTTAASAPAQSNSPNWAASQPNNAWASNNQNETKNNSGWGASDTNNQDDWTNANGGWDNTPGQENQAWGNEQNSNRNADDFVDPQTGITFKRAETNASAPAPAW